MIIHKTKSIYVFLLCFLVVGCATPVISYLPAHLAQPQAKPGSGSVSVNQLLARARGENLPLAQPSATTSSVFPALSKQQQGISLLFKPQSTSLSVIDQRRLQQFSQSKDSQSLYIKCGAAGDQAIESFRIALHRCKNIQRFFELISQTATAQVTAAQPLAYVNVSTGTAAQVTQ